MIPVILSGGSGTRLWPVSRTKLPKQFCDLFGSPMQTVTYRRLQPLGEPWILTSKELQILTETGLRQMGQPLNRVIYEPRPRNTAAALMLMARVFQLRGLGHEVVGVFPSDHVIKKQDDFCSAVQFAAKIAEKGQIVTLGIQPDRPETGYGYIQVNPEVNPAKYVAKRVMQFHEKPNLDLAQRFLREGNYFWNAGIFIFKVDVFLSQIRQHAPQVAEPFEKWNGQMETLEAVLQEVPSVSIDYALMEKLGGTQFLACVPVDIGWNDVGSWDAVADLVEKGTSASVCQFDARNCFVRAPEGKTIALVGVNDLRVVDTGDSLLIAKTGRSQDVRHVVEQLKKSNPEIIEQNSFEDRPWGRFEILRDEKSFKSKVIAVHVGAQISYQSHEQREEFWIVVEGVGEVVLEDQILKVRRGSSIHIPVRAKHRIRNTGEVTLRFVEVQIGSYFGEDDITRYQDDYSRI